MTGKPRTLYSVTLAVSTALLAAGGTAQATDADTTDQSASASSPVQLADAGQAGNAGASSTSSATGNQANPESGPVRLDEVIVTAEKREEQLLTVPVPVTALEASDLENNNQLRIVDWFSQVPGLQLAPSVSTAAPQIAIRGIIAAQGATPTVGITIDGVPYGSSTSFGGGFVAPDIDPSELARVEVLKGPQGTLYGSNSEGGLLQYVTINPSTTELSGRVQAGVSEVQNGAEPGYNFRGAVNIPLSDTLAVRASAFTRQDPGYIDDPTFNEKGVNEVDVYGGRLAALWQPSDTFSAKFAGLLQHSEQFGSNLADLSAGLSDLQQDRLPNTGLADTTTQNYSLTLDGKFGPADLTSITSYNQNKSETTADTPAFDADNVLFFGIPAGDDIEPEEFTTNKWTEELRLTAPLGPSVNWLFGVFYTHESSSFYDNVVSTEPGTELPLGVLSEVFPTMYEEYAAFTDFTFKITSRFDVQVGGRETENKQTYSQAFDGVVSGSNLHSKGNAFTYLLTPRYTLVSNGPTNVMAYVRLASGFRPGGPNAAGVAGGTGVQPTYGEDRTNNYDIGLKADLLDRTLFLDLSLYYIDWKDIQISEVFATSSGYANGNSAKSEGVELQTEWRPPQVQGLTIDLNGSWDDAVLTANLPTGAAFGLNGAQLPFSAKFTGNFDVDQEFPLAGELRGFVGGQLSYVGQRYSLFATSATAPREFYPAYAQINLRAGIKWNTWMANLYATNVANRRGKLSGGITEAPELGIDDAYSFIPPLTVGVEFTYAF